MLHVGAWRAALVAQLDRAFGYGPKGCGFNSYRAHHYRDVAQFGRAHGLGPCGCRFKSCHPDHFEIKDSLIKDCLFSYILQSHALPNAFQNKEEPSSF